MTDDDIISAARKRAKLAADADQYNREAALDDMRNLTGEQWPEDVRSLREGQNRPCLTINRLPQFLRQVTGDLRNTNPAIKIIPGDMQASKETAEVIEGIVRQIQYESDATSIYERAGESAAACSMGYFRVLTDYVDDQSFDQKICIRSIENPFSVYFDPTARKSTREDAGWCLITEIMTEEDFKEAYPDKPITDVESDGRGDGLEFWRSSGDVIVAEYFWKEPQTKTIMQLPGGQVVENAPKGLGKTRTVTYDKIMWAKVSGSDVLEGPQEFPGKHIPVIAVMGEELHTGDRIYRSSVIRFAKDPQRLYNYWRSAQTEMIALQPKAPYLVTGKQVAGVESIWEQANDSNRPYLPYTADANAPGAPQRAMPPVPSSGMMQEVGLAADDMKATTGIYDAGLGQHSSEKSGVAIRQRQLESDVSTSIYSDNMAKAVAHCGRVIVSMIPKIYDTQRVLAVIGQDDTHGMAEVNKLMMSEDGPIVMNSLTAGKYDVRVAVGPNYSTKRQETAESMMQFVQAFPAAAQVAGDLIAGAMDWPDADKIADRLKKMLPPGMVEVDDPQQQAAAQQQAMAAQQQQQQQQAMAQNAAMLQLRELNAKADKSESDAMKAKFDAEKARLELAAMSGQLVPVAQIMPGLPA